MGIMDRLRPEFWNGAADGEPYRSLFNYRRVWRLSVLLLAAVTLDDDELAAYQQRMQTLDVGDIPDWQESVARLKQNACDGFDATADGFIAHIDAKEAGILVFTIPFDKGFSAAIDGRQADVIPCDVAFMGVWVEPGEHALRGAAADRIKTAVHAGERNNRRHADQPVVAHA